MGQWAEEDSKYLQEWEIRWIIYWLAWEWKNKKVTCKDGKIIS